MAPVAAGIDSAERVAVAVPELVDKSAGTAVERRAGERQPEVVRKSVALPGTEAVPEQAAEVRSIVAAGVDTAVADTAELGIERPVDSGSRTALVGVGIVERVDAIAAAELLGSALESRGRMPSRSSTASSRR